MRKRPGKEQWLVLYHPVSGRPRTRVLISVPWRRQVEMKTVEGERSWAGARLEI